MVSLHSVDFVDLNKAFWEGGGRWGLAVACVWGCVGVLGEGGGAQYKNP